MELLLFETALNTEQKKDKTIKQQQQPQQQHIINKMHVLL